MDLECELPSVLPRETVVVLKCERLVDVRCESVVALMRIFNQNSVLLECQ